MASSIRGSLSLSEVALSAAASSHRDYDSDDVTVAERERGLVGLASASPPPQGSLSACAASASSDPASCSPLLNLFEVVATLGALGQRILACTHRIRGLEIQSPSCAPAPLKGRRVTALTRNRAHTITSGAASAATGGYAMTPRLSQFANRSKDLLNSAQKEREESRRLHIGALRGRLGGLDANVEELTGRVQKSLQEKEALKEHLTRQEGEQQRLEADLKQSEAASLEDQTLFLKAITDNSDWLKTSQEWLDRLTVEKEAIVQRLFGLQETLLTCETELHVLETDQTESSSSDDDVQLDLLELEALLGTLTGVKGVQLSAGEALKCGTLFSLIEVYAALTLPAIEEALQHRDSKRTFLEVVKEWSSSRLQTLTLARDVRWAVESRIQRICAETAVAHQPFLRQDKKSPSLAAIYYATGYFKEDTQEQKRLNDFKAGCTTLSTALASESSSLEEKGAALTVFIQEGLHLFLIQSLAALYIAQLRLYALLKAQKNPSEKIEKVAKAAQQTHGHLRMLADIVKLVRGDSSLEASHLEAAAASATPPPSGEITLTLEESEEAGSS